MKIVSCFCQAGHGPVAGTRLALLCGAALFALGTHTLSAQGAPPPTLNITIDPPASSVMVTQTVELITLKVGNASSFTNLLVQLQPPPPGPLDFLDDGNPPDATAADGTFSGEINVPAFPISTNMTLTFISQGLPLSATNDQGELDPTALVFSTNAVDYIVVVRPPNDSFTNAIKVPSIGQLITTTNNWATMEPSEPLHADVTGVDASIWWNWSTPVSTNVLIDTAGSSFDPILAVYRGGTLAALEPVASSTWDAQRNLKANVNFFAEVGVTYRIAVSSRNADDVGDVRLHVAPGWLPDELPPVVTILAPGSETLVDVPDVLVSGTAKDGEPFPTGLERVEVSVNNGPAQLADGLQNWSTRLTLPPGTNIVKAVAFDYAGHTSPAHTVIVRYMNPTNDMFASAIHLTDLGGHVSALNERATREEGEPPHAGNDGGHSIWYSFTAPANGLLSLTTTNSTFDTLLGLYLGDSLTNLTLVAQNDDVTTGGGYSEILAGLEAGQLYCIAVDGYGGESGDISLDWSFATTEDYFSLNYAAMLGGSVTPPAGLYVSGSVQPVTALPSRDFVFEGWEGTVAGIENPLIVTMDQNYLLAPRFRVISFTDDFESGAFGVLPWSFEGDATWFVQNDHEQSGAYAARSGPTLDDSFSALVLTTGMVAGTGSFGVMVNSEQGWDVLEFFINGVPQGRWSGNVPWQTFLFPVPEGTNRLEWRYTKDANFGAGFDAGFIDNLYLPLPDSSLAASVSIAHLPMGVVQVAVQGRPGRTYAIQISPDLITWTDAYSDATPDGSFVWQDPDSISEPMRFYRAVLR